MHEFSRRDVLKRAALGLAVAGRRPASLLARVEVVPPGPVSERVEVEVRIGLRRTGGDRGGTRVRLELLGEGERLGVQVIEVARGNPRLASFRWRPTGRAGPQRLAVVVHDESDGSEQTIGRELRVEASATRALPRFHAYWLDPLGLRKSVYARRRDATADDLRALVAGLHAAGARLLIVTYVEYLGAFFYPSNLRFLDSDVGRETRWVQGDLDVVGTVLAEASVRGMKVILGLGRGGDTHLLWEFDGPGWGDRNARAVERSTAVARELWSRYGEEPSFYGWYLTHEMNDLARASAYYDPLARACHALCPEAPVMVAPAGTPVIRPEDLRASEVDIFAYQDAVGAGYVPNRYTYRPEERLAALGDVFARYARLHQGTGKHIWADVELWEMDGTKGYSGAYPAGPDRVRRQVDAIAPHVDFLTGYEASGFLDPPGNPNPLEDRRARVLFEALRAGPR